MCQSFIHFIFFFRVNISLTQVWHSYWNCVKILIFHAKAAYFQAKLDEVKTSSAYLLNSATKLKVAKSIGQLKCNNKSLVVDDKENAKLVNTFFSSIGQKMARSVKPLYLFEIEEAVSRLSDIPLSCSICKETILIHKLKHYFGIDGNLLDWLKDYLSSRKQNTVINGKKWSDYAQVTYGIPQGSVLEPTLFNLNTSYLPDSVTPGVVYMYADDTSIYFLGDTIDNKLTWSRHILEVKKTFTNKLNLIKRSRFLSKNMRLDLYF